MSHTYADRNRRVLRRRGKSFGGPVVWIVGVLLLLTGIFFALSYLQGPKLLSAQLDTDAVVSFSDQALRLVFDEVVATVESDAVTVAPAAAVKVTSEADVVSVVFTEPLAYSTSYTVTVSGVVSPSGGSDSTVTHSFTTRGPEFVYLDRGESADEIIHTGVDDAERTVLFVGERIQEFVPVGDVLAITTISADRMQSLQLVNPQTGTVEQIELPESGEIADLDASRSGAILGFTIASDDPGPIETISHTLYTVDLERGRDIVAVAGIDGEPMRVTGWQFIPGTSNIVALTTDTTVVKVDLATGEILPLGQYFEFDRISADGSHVVVSDSHGSAAISLADGSGRELAASPIDGQQPFLGHADASASGELVAKMVLVGEERGEFSSVLAYDDGMVSRILYQTVGNKGAILDFSVSPNGQLVAVEVQPKVSVFDSDEYVLNPRPRSVTTYLVDIASGEVTATIEGFGARWR